MKPSKATSVSPSEIIPLALRDFLGFSFCYPEFFGRHARRDLAKDFYGVADPVWHDLTTSQLEVAPSTVKLTVKQERALFLYYNYWRYYSAKVIAPIAERLGIKPPVSRARAVKTQEMIDLLSLSVDRVGGWKIASRFSLALMARDKILGYNLALVPAMAKQCHIGNLERGDVLSVGNQALIRAVAGFDVSRGFKFSTYACRAIKQAIFNAVREANNKHCLFPASYDPALDRSTIVDYREDDRLQDDVVFLRRAVLLNTAGLTQGELRIICLRFGFPWGPNKTSRRPMTLEQVGKIVGLTKERVRQLQNRGLDKLRNHFSCA